MYVIAYVKISLDCIVTVVSVIVELGLVVNTVSVASQQRLLRYIKTSLVVAGQEAV